MTASLDTLQARLDALPRNNDWGVETARILLETSEEIGCSDLHLLTQRSQVLARARCNDGLIQLARLPVERGELLIARFKVLARLPAFIRQEPQDGRIDWQPRPDQPPRHLRVSFLPTIHGESLVVRFPELSDRLLRLENLGMAPDVYTAMTRLLASPEGTILLTGPSGSGKTTTLYAMMQELHLHRGDRLNFLTIEDPVERDLGFASQVQVNEAQGVTFEKALRAGLRHDPNVLLIGEIRDIETARVCVQAGMTGHLVLSTLHAGRVSRVFTRLLSMGLEPYLVASALCGAVAQRLVRTLCTHCRQATPTAHATHWVAPGCEQCAFTGHKGRTGLYELALVDEGLRELILSRSTPGQIAAHVAAHQRGDLHSEGTRLAAEGVISRAELEEALSLEEPAQ
jgi:general secretion pathway protein E